MQPRLTRHQQTRVSAGAKPAALAGKRTSFSAQQPPASRSPRRASESAGARGRAFAARSRCWRARANSANPAFPSATHVRACTKPFHSAATEPRRARLVEVAARFGEAQRKQQHGESGERNRPQAGRPEKRCRCSRQQIDTAPDHAVHRHAHDLPARDRAAQTRRLRQLGVRRCHWLGLYPRWRTDYDVAHWRTARRCISSVRTPAEGRCGGRHWTADI